MWIREVDFPAALIEAHRSGNLVLFVGAGASIDPPSALPSFNRLALDIAEAAGVEAQPADLDKLDVFLGQIEDRHVDVHRMVATRIDVSTSEPNRLHRALADLAAAGAPLRIVTTNYDLHLSTALRERGAAVAEYIGPRCRWAMTSPASYICTAACGNTIRDTLS